MLKKISLKSLTKSRPHATLFIKRFITIGQLPPNVGLEVIQKELQEQRQNYGDHELMVRIVEEKKLLDQFLKKDEYYRQQLSTAVKKLQDRQKNGYNVGEFFWHQLQQEYVTTPAKERQIFKNQIDWLKARQIESKKIFKDMSHDIDLYSVMIK